MARSPYLNGFLTCAVLLILASVALLWQARPPITVAPGQMGAFLAERERLANAQTEAQVLELVRLSEALQGNLLESYADLLTAQRSFAACVIALAVLQWLALVLAGRSGRRPPATGGSARDPSPGVGAGRRRPDSAGVAAEHL